MPLNNCWGMYAGFPWVAEQATALRTCSGALGHREHVACRATLMQLEAHEEWLFPELPPAVDPAINLCCVGVATRACLTILAIAVTAGMCV